MTTQTARKGEPGHIREDRERTERTPTRRERELQRRIRVERTRSELAYVVDRRTGGVSTSFFGELDRVFRQTFGAHVHGRARFESATKAGPGRRMVAKAKAAVERIGDELASMVRRPRARG